MQRDRAAESGSPDSVAPKGDDVNGPATTGVALAPAPAARRQMNGLVNDTAAASSLPGAAAGVPAEQQVEKQENGKKPRLVWTPELHEKFLRACASLGRGNVVPTKILAMMNVVGLTRNNVASHLQKHRLRGVGTRRKRGGNNGGRQRMHRAAPSLHPPPAVGSQAQLTVEATPIPPALNAAPSLHPPAAVGSQAQLPVEAPPTPPALNPPLVPVPPPQGSFVVMSHLQIGSRWHGQQGNKILQAILPADVVHQRPHGSFSAALPPPQLLYPPPHDPTLMMALQPKRIMEQQAAVAAAGMTKREPARAIAPGHHHYHTVAMTYELNATLTGAANGEQSHQRLQPSTPDVGMSRGLCSAPQASMGDEQMTGAHMGVPHLQNVAGHPPPPAPEPAFPAPAGPENGGQQQGDDSIGVLQFWHSGSAPPSMDHEFPPKRPAP